MATRLSEIHRQAGAPLRGGFLVENGLPSAAAWVERLHSVLHPILQVLQEGRKCF